MPLLVAGSMLAAASPAAQVKLPDLIVRSDVLHQTEIDRQTLPGRELLRLATATANVGLGPLEIRGGAIVSATQREVAQRIYRSDGTWFDQRAGVFTYHPEHGHVHFDDWTVFRIRAALEDGGAGAVVAEGSKVSFCLLDENVYDASNPSFDPYPDYVGCGFDVQGLSPGWGDTYIRWLPDQWIDITGVPDGDYWLEVEVDPGDRLIEADEANNAVRVPIRLRPPTARDDRFEENDSIDEAAAREEGGPGSPNLGVIDSRREIEDLSMDDVLDVFAFRLDRPAEATGYVRIESPWSVGDLDLALLDSAGARLAASESLANTEKVALAGREPGAYFIQVTSRAGANPGYTLVIDPSGNPCPPLPPGDPGDADGDRLADGCDNCPLVANEDQTDSNDDGAGDACQPDLRLAEVVEDGGGSLEVRATARDPEGDSLTGTVMVSGPWRRTLELQDALQVASCDRGFLPDGTRGEGIGFTFGAFGAPYLFDLDSLLQCDDGQVDFVLAAGSCDQEEAGFYGDLPLADLPLPAVVCIRRLGARWGGVAPSIESFDLDTMRGHLDTWIENLLEVPFAGALPRRIPLPSMVAGLVYELGIVLTDGATLPVSVRRSFLYSGEREMVINTRPGAAIAAAESVECERPDGGLVILDGRGSTDADSRPGTHDDLASFEWFEDLGGPRQRLLGFGERLETVLPLGVHRIALRVTDSVGEGDVSEKAMEVRDTTPPLAAISAEPTVLWPPDHRMTLVRVSWNARDLCDPEVRVDLASVTSSDGATSEDIQGADVGTSDRGLFLRAERQGHHARTYELTYVARDRSGNAVTCVSTVTVPASQRP